MTWVAVGIAGGGALLGAYSSRQNALEQRKQKQAEMMANAAQIQYSPWTGASVKTEGMGGVPNAGTAGITGALQGGLTGAMMASQFKSAPTAPKPEMAYNGQAMAGGAADNPWSNMQQQKPNLFQDQNGNPFKYS